MDYIINIDTWTSPNKEINEYLKTHDSFSIVKNLMYNGSLNKGIFTFKKNNKEVMWTLTVEDESYDPRNSAVIEIQGGHE